MQTTDLVQPKTPTTASALADLLRWRIGWRQYDLDYAVPNVSSAKFKTAREAVALIKDSDVVASSGFGATGRCSLFFWALREEFERAAKTKNLTWITVSAQGGRGKAPGTIEELALPGLVSTYISGHLETAKAFLELAEKNELDLHTLPQGVLTELIEGQSRGCVAVESEVGLGTFLDPQQGGGSAVCKSSAKNLVSQSATSDALRYELPKITVGVVSAPYADAEGNIYFLDAPTVTECEEIAAAAAFNAGKVLVTVGRIIAKRPDDIAIPAAQVSAVVVNPRYEQIGGVRQTAAWDMFLPSSANGPEAGLQLVDRINGLMGYTAKRTNTDRLLARAAASIFANHTLASSLVNIGVGMPEEVGRVIHESGNPKGVTFTTEAGVLGGLPLPGIFFGTAAKPERIESSYWMFQQYQQCLDTTVLGFLEVDSQGNVNVSRRGQTVGGYVGPGGFIDIVEAAKTIIFVGRWMVGGDYQLKNGRLQVKKLGRPKFVQAVTEVTFNASRALRQGKQIFYVTEVGAFQLTESGLTLISVANGVDVDRDIVAVSEADIYVQPHSPSAAWGRSVMTGETV